MSGQLIIVLIDQIYIDDALVAPSLTAKLVCLYFTGEFNLHTFLALVTLHICLLYASIPF